MDGKWRKKQRSTGIKIEMIVAETDKVISIRDLTTPAVNRDGFAPAPNEGTDLPF